MLTPAGERLLRSARAVLEELDRAEEEIRRGAGRPRGVIRLTTQCNTVYHWLPSRLRRFQRTHPDVDLEVVAGATDDPIPALLGGAHRPRDRPSPGAGPAARGCGRCSATRWWW